MLPIIVRIITFALGSVLNKGVSIVRNAAADKLKDGDVIHENWREAISEDLDDIKTKIDGLARTDLLSSYSFLEDGIGLLLLALDEAKVEQTSKDEANGLQDVGSTATMATATTMTTTATATIRNESDSVDLNEVIALSNAIQKLRNESVPSNDRFVSAKECFKDARVHATRAFFNEALKLPDRIMAAKIRVVSKILECLQDTKAATSGCMLFLKDLNHLPAIGETFSTYFKYTSFSSLKSKFYKGARLENVKSVLSLNLTVSEFVAKFSGELPNVRNWPRIHLSTENETIHPLLLDIEIVQQIFRDEEFQPPKNCVPRPCAVLQRCCINSKGKLNVLCEGENHCAFIFVRKGEPIMFCDCCQGTKNCENRFLKADALTVDRYDNLYVIAHSRCPFLAETSGRLIKSSPLYTYYLFIFDSNGTMKCKKVIDSFLGLRYRIANCVVNRDGDVIIFISGKNNLYVYDSDGNLKSHLSLDNHYRLACEWDFISLGCVTGQNEIIMISRIPPRLNDTYMLVYTKEGKLKQWIYLIHSVYAVTYNYATSKIEILVGKESTLAITTSYCILSYSENYDVECLYLPVAPRLGCPTIVTHPTGHAAFVYDLPGEFEEILPPVEPKAILM